ncbi:hypothetical protein [Streptomyces sp. NPDC004296]|uniref:hypothetical protein n=1 Tax=Streptomyces sp. NPDC004296 TaxID=3364697 RepID=UPI0036CCF9FF
MSYTTTTSYGTWCNQVAPYSTSPDADVLDYINGGDSDWQQLLEASGALDQIQREYRDAINAALPDSISLCGDEFIGPAYPEDDEFDGYPRDEIGRLDFKAMVEDINLGEIVERNEPLTAEEIGRWELKSEAKDPAKSASRTMQRLGVKPFHYRQHPESGRPQALYRAGEVRAAIAERPGRGARTDLAEAQ